MNLAIHARAMARVARARGEAEAAEWEAIASEADGDRAGYVGPEACPYTSRWFWSRARERNRTGKGGVLIRGRQVFMTPEALDEELAQSTKRKSEPVSQSGADVLRRQLGLVAGGRR